MTNTYATIAIVDDDDSIRHALRQLLRAADFDALTFATAEDFLRSGECAHVDCLIADINLPGMSDGSVTIVDLKTEAVVGSMDTLKLKGFNPNSMVLLPQWNDLAGH